MSRCHIALALLLAWSVAGHAQTGTVPGPEAKTLLPASAGYLVMNRGAGGIIAIQLPTLQETIVRPVFKDMSRIHALSGPDREGRIAYIEDHDFGADDRHLLKTIKLDGSQDTELFSRPGNALWAGTGASKGDIGEHLALAPIQGRIVLLTELSSMQMFKPQVLLQVGSIEVWDADKKTGKKTGIQALDDSLAWFPDGKRLAYTKMADLKVLPAPRVADDSFGKGFKHWEKIPAVFVYDFDAGTDTFLHLGWHPVVSSDGQFVLVTDWDGVWKRVDVATGKAGSVTWLGSDWGPVAYPAQDIVLSWSPPTQGTKIEYTKGNSPLVGPKQMLTIKLARLNTTEIQTVVPYIDPRTRISFGQVAQKKEK